MMFALGGLRARRRRPGVLARRARAAGDGRRVGAGRARRRSCAATVAATAATSCTSGSPSCSSASPPRRPSSDARDVRLSPGQSAQGRRLRRSPTSSRRRAPGATRADQPRRGAARAPRTASAAATLRTERGYFPVERRRRVRAGRRASSAGEATSEVGLKAGLTRDSVDGDPPDIVPLQPLLDDADRRLRPRSSPRGAAGIVARGDRGALRSAARRPPRSASIVSPLVTWIWIGALIVMVGGLIAIWPAAARCARGA